MRRVFLLAVPICLVGAAVSIILAKRPPAKPEDGKAETSRVKSLKGGKEANIAWLASFSSGKPPNEVKLLPLQRLSGQDAGDLLGVYLLAPPKAAGSNHREPTEALSGLMTLMQLDDATQREVMDQVSGTMEAMKLDDAPQPEPMAEVSALIKQLEQIKLNVAPRKPAGLALRPSGFHQMLVLEPSADGAALSKLKEQGLKLRNEGRGGVLIASCTIPNFGNVSEPMETSPWGFAPTPLQRPLQAAPYLPSFTDWPPLWTNEETPLLFLGPQLQDCARWAQYVEISRPALRALFGEKEREADWGAGGRMEVDGMAAAAFGWGRTLADRLMELLARAGTGQPPFADRHDGSPPDQDLDLDHLMSLCGSLFHVLVWLDRANMGLVLDWDLDQLLTPQEEERIMFGRLEHQMCRGEAGLSMAANELMMDLGGEAKERVEVSETEAYFHLTRAAKGKLFGPRLAVVCLLLMEKHYLLGGASWAQDAKEEVRQRGWEFAGLSLVGQGDGLVTLLRQSRLQILIRGGADIKRALLDNAADGVRDAQLEQKLSSRTRMFRLYKTMAKTYRLIG